MLAVIKTGGKQYCVSAGDILKIEKIEGAVGAKVGFDEVLMLADENSGQVEVGQPFLPNRKVEAEIVEQGRGEKVIVMKFKSKVRYKRKKGHRQAFTKIRVSKV